MPLQPLALKVVAGAGSMLITGACAGVVALDTRPATAPLHPPVDAAATIAGDSGAAATPAGAAALQVPPTPVCHGGASRAAGSAASMSPAVRQALVQVQQAKTRQAKAAVFAQLPVDVRTQVTALLAARARSSADGATTGCQSAAAGGGQARGSISAGVVDAPATAPTVTDTYVS